MIMAVSKDLTGRTINGIYVKGLAFNNGRNYWDVICKCGKDRKPMLSSEINRFRGGCSCSKDLSNTDNGQFLVGEYLYSHKHNKFYSCLCKDCGSFLEAPASTLLSGSDFCGCPKIRVTDLGDHLEITSITKNYTFNFLIDHEDLHLVKRNSWHLTRPLSEDKLSYVSGRGDISGTKLLHREIMKPEAGLVVDHINGNTLDNRKINLRVTTYKSNAKNCKLPKNNTSGQMGVIGRGEKWLSYISVDGKHIHLGMYDTFAEAVKVRKDAEVLYGFHENHGRNT